MYTDLSSDLRIRQAWTRRSLAYDQANLISFLVLERWASKLVARMHEVPPKGYRRITLEQCLNADQRLWVKISEECRASIQPKSVNGRLVKPLDDAIALWSDHPDVMYLIQPLPLVSADSQSDQFGGEDSRSKRQKTSGKGSGKNQAGKQVPEGKGGKGKGKGKASGKGKNRPKVSAPPGCESRTEDGRFICYGFQNGTCSAAAVGGSCTKGYHICGKKGCHGNHTLGACPNS
jgi:hypothetical protein